MRHDARSDLFCPSDAWICRLPDADRAHPGGGVTGAPGHNAAQAVITDLSRDCEPATASQP